MMQRVTTNISINPDLRTEVRAILDDKYGVGQTQFSALVTSLLLEWVRERKKQKEPALANAV